MRMTVVDSFDDLINKALDEVWRELFLDFSEVFLKIVLDIFKDQVKRIMRVDNFLQPKG